MIQTRENTMTIFEITITTTKTTKTMIRKSEKAARALVAKAEGGDNFRAAHVERVQYDADGTTTTHILSVKR